MRYIQPTAACVGAMLELTKHTGQGEKTEASGDNQNCLNNTQNCYAYEDDE